MLKEPLIRDLATMNQSFYYLAFNAFAEILRKKVKNEFMVLSRIGKKIIRQKNPFITEWTLFHTVNLAYVYSHVTSREVLGRDLFNYKYPLKKTYHAYLAPWIIERALYETQYELMYSESRPGWFIIPLTSIINPVIPVIKPNH